MIKAGSTSDAEELASQGAALHLPAEGVGFQSGNDQGQDRHGGPVFGYKAGGPP